MFLLERMDDQGVTTRACCDLQAVFVEAGGGTVLNQRTLTGRELAAEIVQIITDPERHRRMADASHQFGRPNAGKAIAKSIYSLMRRQAE